MPCDGTCEHAKKAKEAGVALEAVKATGSALAKRLGLSADADCNQVAAEAAKRLDRLDGFDAEAKRVQGELADKVTDLAIKMGEKGDKAKVRAFYDSWPTPALEQHCVALEALAGKATASKGRGDPARFTPDSDAPVRRSPGLPERGTDGRLVWKDQ
ncbi:MAG: hypothetical protein ABR562_03685 [Thermoplasmatota archaeon]